MTGAPGFLPSLLLALGACAMFALRLAARRRPRLRPLGKVAGLLGWYLLLRLVFGFTPGPWREEMEPYWRTVLLLVLALAGVRLGVWLLLDLPAARRREREVADILKDLSTAVLFTLSAFIILRHTLDVDLASLIATSAVLSIILGLALQETLANMFAGLSIQMEKPFRLGEWISFDAHTGQVEAINWRSTTVRTLLGDQVTTPNSLLAKSVLTNYSRPTTLHGLTVKVGLPYDAAPNRAKEAILEAFDDYPDVASEPAPEVRLVSYDDFSMSYETRFFITDFARHQRIRDEIMSRIWYHLKRNGITIPFPIRDVNLKQVTPALELETRYGTERRVAEALGKADFLAPLSEAERAELAGMVRPAPMHRDEVIIRQGDPGDSCFIIMSGLAEVSVTAPGGKCVVRELGPGQVFGEMSLMTGEARSATVRALTDMEVVRVSKTSFARILAANPRIAEEISAVLARRQLELEERKRERAGLEAREAVESRASHIIAGIRQFFGL